MEKRNEGGKRGCLKSGSEKMVAELESRVKALRAL